MTTTGTRRTTTATTETTGTTTEASPAARARTRPTFSVRARIIAVILLLTALAMTGAGIIVYALESDRIDRRASEQIDQEIAELSQLRQDPATGRPFTDVQRLLEVFLSRNVPDDDEMLVGYAEGDAELRTQNRYGEEIFADPEYERVVRDLLADGGFRTIESAQFGEVWVTVVPVRNRTATNSGALAIVTFLDDEHEELDRTMRTYAVVAAVSILVIAFIATLQSGRLLAPLRRLRETTDEITETDLARRLPESGNDDITALTRTVNAMLARLEAAFVGQRQFLDDAGHELRTPLTVLRGHLELLDPDDPEDVATTRDLLLDEVDRMGRLVGDLILLAKSRRPDFLSPQPTSLERLTHTLLAKARGMAVREWQLDGAAQVIVDVDEQRLTQAVLQLVDNAVKHTGDDDTIAVGSSYDGRSARLWVRDTGAGVPEADREHVFDRFGRSVVHEGDEGFGLGLSIVRAIAEAHGGTVHVEDAPPGGPTGAVFVITLGTMKEEQWPAS
jgi:two-component system, OmpR family, sensor kinase